MPGTLFYVVGPSGAGKDSLMGYARARVQAFTASAVFFAHRYITRPAEAGGENHIAVSPVEFERMRALDLFALNWESHGHAYGIGREIDLWLQRGASVVMNGSRGYLAEAARRYPDFCVISIEVSLHVLRTRLESRGRESARDIAARLARAGEYTVDHPRLVRIHNDGELAEAGDRLLRVLAFPPIARVSEFADAG